MPVHALAPRTPARLGDLRRGNDDDREVDRVGNLEHVGYARTPATEIDDGFTGYTGPSNPYASRLRNSSWPIVPAVAARADHRDRTRREQPRDRRRLRVALARFDHADRRRSSARSRSARGPFPVEMALGRPARVGEHVQHLRCCPAACRPTNVVMPFARAMPARCSSSSVASPRRCWSSATANATSASSGPTRS